MISVARIMDARQDYMRILFGEIDFVPEIEEMESKEHQSGAVDFWQTCKSRQQKRAQCALTSNKCMQTSHSGAFSLYL